jgi:hypothetical protein
MQIFEKVAGIAMKHFGIGRFFGFFRFSGFRPALQ